MGSTILKSEESLPNLQQDYLQVVTEEGDTVYRNRLTREEIQEFDLLLDSEVEFQREKQVYLFRKNNPYIVSTKHFLDNSVEDFCSTSYRVALFIEYIPLRLSNIKDIPYPDSLHLIETCLRGFALLYEKGGYFRVEENLIGINGFGEAKVWINADFSKSEPEIQPAEYVGTEADIVLRIIGLIERNTDPGTSTLSFPAHYKATPCGNTFKEAMRRFYEYVSLTAQDVPPVMECTLSIVRKQDYITEECVKRVERIEKVG